MEKLHLYEANFGKGKKGLYVRESEDGEKIVEIEDYINSRVEQILAEQEGSNFSVEEIVILIEQYLSELGFKKVEGRSKIYFNNY